MEKETAPAEKTPLAAGNKAKGKSIVWMAVAAVSVTLLIILGIMIYVIHAQKKISERFVKAAEQGITLSETGEVVTGVVDEKKSGMTSCNVPAGVTTIGAKAFADCKKLQSVTLPKTISAIGHEAFAGCVELKNLDIPEGLSAIGSEAFRGCTIFNQEELTIPASVRVVADGAFVDMQRVNLRDNDPDFRKGPRGEIIDIKDDKLVFVPPAVLEKGKYTTPEVSRIGGKAFFNGKKLTDIVISKKVFFIGEEAFAYCESLTDVTIPGNVKTVSARVFDNCKNLKSVVFEDGVKVLGREMFRNCGSLASVKVPASVNTIADGAFIGVNGIELDAGSVYFTQGKRGDIFAMINSLSKDEGKRKDSKLIYVPGSVEGEYVVPENVKSIAPDAFNGCEKLTRVVIADDVAEIGAKAFTGCKNLKEIEIPDSLDDSHTEMEKRLEKLGLPKDCRITVRKN